MQVDLLKRLSVGLSGVGNSPREVMQLAKKFEDAGFAIIGAGDSTYDSFVSCASMACATEKVGIRTGVALWGRSPVQTVFAAATMDELSGGRFRLGLGTGPKARSEQWHGVSYEKVVGRFRDYVTAIKTAWQGVPGNPVSYEGEYYQFKNFQLFRKPPTGQIGIDLAANGPQMIKAAAQIGDRVLLNNLHGGRYLREVVEPAVRAGEAKAGRPKGSVKIGGGFLISVAPSKEEALEIARQGLMYNMQYEYNQDLLDWYGMQEQRARIQAALATKNPDTYRKSITDDVVELFAVCGDADYCRRTVASYGDVMDEAGVVTAAWRGQTSESGYNILLDVFGY